MNSTRVDRPGYVLWAAILVAIPVTSFRYFPFLSPTTQVRPLAAYPLALWLLWWLFWGRKSRPLPWSRAWLPLALFLLAWLTATGYGWLLDPIPLRGQEFLSRTLRAWVTLGLGLSFFLAAVVMTQKATDVRFAVRWLLAGMVLTGLWSGVQMVAFYTPWLTKATVRDWQLLFSVRGVIKTRRVSGLAFEPSWLAAQLATLYLPWFLAAALQRTPLTGKRALDGMLALLALIVLLATYSRGGILIVVCMTLGMVLLFGRTDLRRLGRWYLSGFRQWKALFVRLLVSIVAGGAFVAAALFAARHPYFRALWETRADTLNDYLVKVYAGPRAAYALSALAAWEQSPWLGVGPGAAGFYMYRALPEWVLTFIPEIAQQLSPTSHLFPNPKNLYARLLAEGGLLGATCFLLFWLSVLGETLSLLRADRMGRLLALTGIAFFLAALLWNFTQDSLAQPNLWLIPGMVVGYAASRPSG